jgi:parvulin-like peptidyl-prolyl isomerase
MCTDRDWVRKSACLALVVVVAFLALPHFLFAAEDPATESAKPSTPPATREGTAATVNGEAIPLSKIDEAVRAAVQGRPVDEASLKRLQAEALAQLIDQALIIQMLTKGGQMATDTEVQQAIENLKKQAADRKVDFAKVLADRRVSEEQLRTQIRWQLTADRFIQKSLTDAALKSFFDANKRDFDGTELRVSHILLRPDDTNTPAEIERLTKMAAKLRERIESKTIGFEAAAERYSAGPSRRRNGDLGFMPRNGLMAEPFAAAAFKLMEGQLSEPVVSPYGVHLIKVTGAKPGTKGWEEVKDQLKPQAAQRLMENITAAERKKADIQFTGACPYFKPGTRELVEK